VILNERMDFRALTGKYVLTFHGIEELVQGVASAVASAVIVKRVYVENHSLRIACTGLSKRHLSCEKHQNSGDLGRISRGVHI
jgi:hypothetical protein